MIRWNIFDNDGKQREIIVEAYYVLSAKVRLISVQPYLGKQEGRFILEGAKAQFYL